MAGKLTDTKIKKLRKSEKDYRESDGGSLYLKINKAGTKSWQFRYKSTWIGLGSYPSITLASARSKARELKQVVANGDDPKVYLKELELKDNQIFTNIANEYARNKIDTNTWTGANTSKKLNKIKKD